MNKKTPTKKVTTKKTVKKPTPKKTPTKKPTPKPIEEETLDLTNVEPTPSNEIKGLGDVIKKVTEFFGIEQCDKCKLRQSEYNAKYPFTRKANPMDDNDIQFIKRIMPLSIIGQADKEYIFHLYNKIFRTNEVVCNCSSKIVAMRIKLWNVYVTNHSTDENETAI